MYFFYYLPVGINAALRRFPFMTAAYTVICAAVFALYRYNPGNLDLDIFRLVYVPAQADPLTAIGAAFLHTGYVHLIGNLVYLTFFGRYVEDRMGPVLFTMIFISSAAIGNYLQGLFNIHFLHEPYLGIIGASGAVSGLLGAFTVRFTRSRLQVAYWTFFPLQAYTRAGRVEMPALFAIGLWFILQVVRGAVQTAGAGASVAYVTHVSGFVWGAALALISGHYGLGRIESLLQRGKAYIENGEPYAAQGAFIRYLTHQPDDADVYASLARAMVLSGNTEGARKNYRQACEMLLAQGRRGQSEELFREVLRGFDDFTLAPDAHLRLAFGLERDLKPRLALKAYENFERRYPMHREAPFALLRAASLHWHAFSDFSKSDFCYRKLVDKYPDDQWVDFAHEQIRCLSFRLTPSQ